jgi:hypothetical protein
MSKLDPSDLAALGLDELHELVAALLERVAALETENAALRDENARLKGLKGRPKIKPSGMEAKAGASTTTTGKRRGKGMRRADGSSKNSRRVLAVSEEQRLEVEVPPGSRFKGFEDFVVQDLRLEGRVIRYRRERWLTPDGRTVTAPLPARLCGHFGPELVRFVILQHVQGQVTTERLTAMLNEIGIVISKRQVIRLLNGDPGGLNGEAAQLFRAGLETANWITVDDTGARHGACNGVTTQIGDGRFTHFATTFSKSRRNFLELLRAGHHDYVINGAAVSYMRAHSLTGSVIAQLEAHDDKAFANRKAFLAHLSALAIDRLDVTPDPVKIATEGGLWGSIHHHGLLNDTVIVSDGAGQFRIGQHALCWVHAERLIHKLIGFNDPQRRAIDLVRQLVWWFYADLKAYKREPRKPRAAQLRARFERIFKRKTGFVTLDRLLARLHARKQELLLVLDRPEIPLHTNGSENDIRCHVTKRKVSGGTWSEAGRQARDTLLACMKTCQKLDVSFFQFLGNRLGVPNATTIPPLAQLVTAAKA